MTRSAFAALAVAISSTARAGLVLQYEDDQKKRTTVELEGKSLRSAPEGGPRGSWTIFDGDRRVFYVLDPQEKTYHRMDEATGAAMGKRLHDAMEKARAKMTPEQRARMEAMLAKQGAPGGAPAKEHSWRFERAGGGQTVAGYACESFRVLRDGKLDGEGCFVPWGSGPFRKDDFQPFQEMGRFFQKTFAAMSEGMRMSGQRAPTDTWLLRFVETAPGFPALMDRVDEDGKRTREMRLVRIERASIPAGRFAPPADYREKPSGPLGGGEE